MTQATQYLNKLELRFWKTINPLMAHSRLVRRTVRLVYFTLEGDFWKVFVRNMLISAAILFAVAFLSGYFLG